VLELVAPALGYRETLLEVSHQQNRIYPATVRMPENIRWSTDPERYAQHAIASSPDQLLELLRVALRSQPARSAINTLLARSNELRDMSAAVSAAGS
jgi:hypothetical protein